MLTKALKTIVNSKEGRNASWIIIGRIIQMVLSFFVSIFTARYLGPSNYGKINYALAYVAFFTSFCTLGINSVIIKDFIENPNEQGLTIGTSLFCRLISSALSFVMIIVIVWIVDGNKSGETVIAGLCGSALIFQVFDTINYWFQSRYESKTTAKATLFAYFITSLYKIILLIFKKNVLWFAFATSVDYIVMASCLIYAYNKKRGPRWNVSIKKAKMLLHQSYHYILSGMMVAIYGQTDKLMLKKMLGPTDVGYYSLASSINGMWVFVLAAIIDSMYPTIIKFSKEDKKLYNKKNRQLYAIVIYISIFVAIGIVTLGKFMIILLYGKEYEPAFEPLKIVCWYTIFSYLGVARNAWIVCENKQNYLKYIYFSAVIINILLNIIFIPYAGASGAALASLLTQVCTSIVIPVFIRDLRGNVKLMLDAMLLKEIK